MNGAALRKKKIRDLAERAFLALCSDPECGDPVRTSWRLAKEFLEEADRQEQAPGAK